MSVSARVCLLVFCF